MEFRALTELLPFAEWAAYNRDDKALKGKEEHVPFIQLCALHTYSV